VSRFKIECMFELTDADEAGLIDEISRLERVKSAAAAGQARLTAALTERRRAAEAAAGVPRPKQCRGLACEVALARRDPPVRGGRHLGFATALVFEMPHTLAALECGALSEWRATLIVKESACLTVEDRRTLDAEMCADVAALDGLGDARITADAKKIAYRLDPQAVVDRAAKAEGDRTVTIRPAPDAMTYVTVLLPVAKGVGVYATLKRAADSTFDDRSRGRVRPNTVASRSAVCHRRRGRGRRLGRRGLGWGRGGVRTLSSPDRSRSADSGESSAVREDFLLCASRSAGRDEVVAGDEVG
jgi:hypothetical protein